MEIEYEATFYPVDKDTIRIGLRAAGAEQIYPEKLMQRVTFTMPEGQDSERKWARVRDENGLITMSIKEVTDSTIEGTKEAIVTIDSLENGIVFLEALGCTQKAFQETKRELWRLDGVDVTIDEWPFLEAFVEIEGESEKAVREVSERLGFEWSAARFCVAGTLYHEKYGLSEQEINNKLPRIVFGEQNPFLR